ncbi:CocE/NonD family hydrolase [Candidatus Poseidonia alphae]|nr:CocE/NonD family hydrolase [Candidatus Poseidonia alphae]MDA8748766.1 CocE/NonD family hydrolase [Candidatus Poseidonia alphae]MDB2335965.1 CocE/NonD family hydrolase [Candidatus Poseidonia alphae]
MVFGATIAISLAFLFAGALFVDTVMEGLVDEEPAYNGRVPVWEREMLDFETSGDFGIAIETGPYTVLSTDNEWNSTHHFVEYIMPIEEGGAAPNGLISLAVWRPNVPEGTLVPVIAEFGPYFQEQSVETPTIEVPGTWLGQMIIDQLLPHGYAFAQVSVSGTGRSNHCMDLMGNAEQLGNDAAVRWLGEQTWSNGAVGMIGKSYDGSTPWQAAMFGSEHDYLKTIVPISGLIGVKELMWRNGSAEARAPIMHNGVYGSYGIDGDEEDYQNICPDYLIGPGTGVSAYLFGSEVAGEYWAERYFLDRVLQHYTGSVYLIQGMHDWNVDPHMAVPTINALKDAGIDAKGLFGQWDHDYPDRPVQLDDRSDLGGRGGEAFPEMVRYDWMQDLLEWFDFYLRGVGDQPGLWVEIQSNQGSWRLEDRYPPADISTLEWDLGGVMENVGGSTTVTPGLFSGPVWESQPLNSTLYLAGVPRLHVDVTTATLGGQLYALLEDCNQEDNCIHIGHAIMDLRYHAGGDEIQTWVPVIETINAKMEFMPLDAEIEEGHRIRISLLANGEDYLPASTSSIVFIQEGASSTLQLDTFSPDERRYFTPPVCTHELCIQATES